MDAGEGAAIIAHRGGAAVAPENTMAAFERGIADGADWLELDVQVVVLQDDVEITPERPLEILYSDTAVFLGMVYSYLPFMVLPIYASVERYNFTLSEAAADLYADRWTTLTHVLLPAVRPGVVAGCILVFIPSLGAFLAPDLLGDDLGHQPTPHRQVGVGEAGAAARELVGNDVGRLLARFRFVKYFFETLRNAGNLAKYIVF